MKMRTIFRLLDADTDLEAQLVDHGDAEHMGETHIIISQPDRSSVVMSLEEFHRLAAAVERHTT